MHVCESSEAVRTCICMLEPLCVLSPLLPDIRTYILYMYTSIYVRIQNSCTIVSYQGFQLWSPLNSFTNACHSCQSGMWLQHTSMYILDIAYCLYPAVYIYIDIHT